MDGADAGVSNLHARWETLRGQSPGRLNAETVIAEKMLPTPATKTMWLICPGPKRFDFVGIEV